MSRKYSRQEIAQATAAWLAANPGQAVLVVDDDGVSWAVPRRAREAIILQAALQDARAALRHPAAGRP